MHTSNRDYREFALSHKGGECEVCGDTDGVVVHHMNGDRSDNELDNLAVLCRTHHAKVHHGNPEVSEYVKELPDTEVKSLPEDMKGEPRKTITLPAELFDTLNENRWDRETWAGYFWRMLSKENGGDRHQETEPQDDEFAQKVAERTVDELVQRMG